jgi:hypothetical protein
VLILRTADKTSGIHILPSWIQAQFVHEMRERTEESGEICMIITIKTRPSAEKNVDEYLQGRVNFFGTDTNADSSFSFTKNVHETFTLFTCDFRCQNENTPIMRTLIKRKLMRKLRERLVPMDKDVEIRVEKGEKR